MKIDLSVALTIGALLVTIGLFMGRLEQRISQLETHEQYLHGNIEEYAQR